MSFDCDMNRRRFCDGTPKTIIQQENTQNNKQNKQEQHNNTNKQTQTQTTATTHLNAQQQKT